MSKATSTPGIKMKFPEQIKQLSFKLSEQRDSKYNKKIVINFNRESKCQDLFLPQSYNAK